jgi:hypothetical protein
MVRLVALGPSQLGNFVNSLKKAKPEASIFRLAGQLAAANPEIDLDDIYEILDMLASLYRYHANVNAPAKILVDGFISAAKQEANRGGISAITVWPKLRESLRIIFGLDGSLGITAKATELALEHERLFCPASSRILTDVRPVFLASASETPHAAIIQHTLKLAYHVEEGKTSEFYVALDQNDVDFLMYLLARCKQKEKSLRKMLKSTGIKLMASEEENE